VIGGVTLRSPAPLKQSQIKEELTAPFQSFRLIGLWLGLSVLGVVLALLWRRIGAQL
jgi:hypothetical protein